MRSLFPFLCAPRLYGTAQPDADYDFVAITTVPVTNVVSPAPAHEAYQPDLPVPVRDMNVHERHVEGVGEINVSFYDRCYWDDMLLEHRMPMLESLSLTPDHPAVLLGPYAPQWFRLDQQVLRKTVSWESNLKFSHAKRRLGDGRGYKCVKVSPDEGGVCICWNGYGGGRGRRKRERKRARERGERGRSWREEVSES